jgi:hypothetical protein
MIEPAFRYTLDKQTHNVRSLARAMLDGRMRAAHYHRMRKIHARLPDGALKTQFYQRFLEGRRAIAKEVERRHRVETGAMSGRNILYDLRWRLSDPIASATTSLGTLTEEELTKRVSRVKAGDYLIVMWNASHPSVAHGEQYPPTTKPVEIQEPTVAGIMSAAREYAYMWNNRVIGRRAPYNLRMHGLSHGRMDPIGRRPEYTLRRVAAHHLGLNPQQYPRIWKMSII